MSLSYQILGGPGADNALFVTLDTGHSQVRLLFDCGQGCLEAFRFGEILDIDYVFFSHLHMDHVSGFDSFFRVNADRTEKPNVIFGPPGTSEILQHRFQGYLWNLVEGAEAQWWVCDIDQHQMQKTRFDLDEAFAQAYPEPSQSTDGIVLATPHFTVKACTRDHHAPSLAYIVRESSHTNVSIEQLSKLGLRPGAWLQRVKSSGEEEGTVDIEGRSFELSKLRELLLVEQPGQSIAYLTDFLLDDVAMSELEKELQGVDTIICESQYHPNDHELAIRHFHMTSVQAATLAKRVNPKEFILIHLSHRYTPAVWKEMLTRAQHVFPRAKFPDHWQTELNA